MEIINIPKGTGKTDKLIEIAKEKGYPIIVASKGAEVNINNKAYLKYGHFNGVTVFTVHDFMYNTNGLFTKDTKVLVDDIENVLQAFVGFEIDTATCSIPFSKEEEIK